MDLINLIKTSGIAIFLVVSLAFVVVGLLTTFVLVKYGKNKTTALFASLIFFGILLLVLSMAIIRFSSLLN